MPQEKAEARKAARVAQKQFERESDAAQSPSRDDAGAIQARHPDKAFRLFGMQSSSRHRAPFQGLPAKCSIRSFGNIVRMSQGGAGSN